MKKSVNIILDKPRELRFGTNSLILLEELIGSSITKMDFNNIGIKDLRMILYAGLKHEDKGLTLEETGDLIDCSDFETISKAVGDALTLSFGNGKKGNSEQGK